MQLKVQNTAADFLEPIFKEYTESYPDMKCTLLYCIIMVNILSLIFEVRFFENQKLFNLPICRNGKDKATVGLDIKAWESWK